MADHWRDQHRAGGKFKPRPGAKGFKAEDRPQPAPAERRPFSLWIEKNKTAGDDDGEKR